MLEGVESVDRLARARVRAQQALQKRIREMADRAYLIRNFAVHQASRRGPVLILALPGFAGLVQAAVARTLRTDPTDENVLAEALHANTVVWTLSAKLARRSRCDPIRGRAVSSEPEPAPSTPGPKVDLQPGAHLIEGAPARHRHSVARALTS